MNDYHDLLCGQAPSRHVGQPPRAHEGDGPLLKALGSGGLVTMICGLTGDTKIDTGRKPDLLLPKGYGVFDEQSAAAFLQRAWPHSDADDDGAEASPAPRRNDFSLHLGVLGNPETVTELSRYSLDEAMHHTSRWFEYKYKRTPGVRLPTPLVDKVIAHVRFGWSADESNGGNNSVASHHLKSKDGQFGVVIEYNGQLVTFYERLPTQQKETQHCNNRNKMLRFLQGLVVHVRVCADVNLATLDDPTVSVEHLLALLPQKTSLQENAAKATLFKTLDEWALKWAKRCAQHAPHGQLHALVHPPPCPAVDCCARSCTPPRPAVDCCARSYCVGRWGSALPATRSWQRPSLTALAFALRALCVALPPPHPPSQQRQWPAAGAAQAEEPSTVARQEDSRGQVEQQGEGDTADEWEA